MKGLVFASGSWASAGRLAGVITSTTPGWAFRGRNVEKSDAAARDAADRQDRVEHAGRMLVGGVAGGTRDFEHPVPPGEGLTDVRAVPNMRRRLGECDLRHG
jgi:hypothetical protein